MAYENLKSAIKQAIKQNGNQEITGSLLQGTLLSMVDTIGADIDTELGKKANKADIDTELGKKANKADIDTELGKKFDKTSIVQESGDSEELVMSQKVVSDSLYSLTEEVVGYSDFEDIKGRLSVAQNNKVIKDGTVTNQNRGFITTPLQVYKGDTVKITAHYYPSCDAIAIDNGDDTYTKVVAGSSSSQSSSTATLQWTAPKDCMVVFSGIDWDTQYNVAKIFLLRSSKVETKVNNILYKKRAIEFNTELTPGLLNIKVTLGNKFPFGGHSSMTGILRGIFEVKEGEKVYFSTLPNVINNFSGCAVLDKNYIVISLIPASNEIYFEVPAGGKYVVFQTLTASGYPTIYVESLEDTTEEIDTTDLELLQEPTINCLQAGRAYIFGDIGTKVTESDNWKNINTTCYSCVPGDVFYITGICTANYTSAFAVVSENNVILAKDTRPTGFWHYMTKVVVHEGGAKLLVNNIGNLCVYKKKAIRDIYPEKEPLVAATSLATVGSNYSDRRLRLSWASDTHADTNLYKRWIDWTNRHIGMFDAALHTGDFNRMADADNGFVVTALKYRTILPFLPTLGNHDCFGYTVDLSNTLNSGSLEWNGNKYIKPFVENDSAYVVSNDGCYYYRDFTDKKIRMIVINDYDKPRWADGTYWITTTDESEIASAVEWTSDKSYAVGDVVHYKGMYVKCKTAGVLDDKAHVWKPVKAVLSKTITDCRYINQAQADFIVNAMNVDSGWGIIFVTHQPYEALPAGEHCISKWTLRRDLVNTYVGVKFGQNGYMIQDLITAYLNKTTLNKTYECITPNVDPLSSKVVKTNLPDFYPDVTINVDFTNAVGDVICCLNGHQHSDTAYWSQHTGENKVLCIGAPTGCYLPFDLWSNPWPAGDIAKSGSAKDCFNAISIDTTEKAIYLVRIGADKTDQFETRDYIRISYAHN